MSLTVAVERYGDDAFGALAQAVRRAKDGDLLAPVTVIVPRGSVGLAARRRLAASPPGVIGVAHVTLARLAGDLALRPLAGSGRRPVTQPLLRQAVRHALARSSGSFLGSAADQPATVRAMVRTYHELAGASEATLDALAMQSSRASEVVRVVRAARRALAGHYDEAALVREATAVVRRDPAPVVAALGQVVVYLPVRLAAPGRELVTALAGVLPVTVVVGATGDEVADGPARSLVAQLGSGIGTRPWPVPDMAGTYVRVAPSADAEVLLALRHLMAHHGRGVPLERMALVDGGSPPYPRLVHEVVARAGIPCNGPGVRSLASTAAGRTLLGALELRDRDWRRDEVMAWVASVPMVWHGEPVPAAAWDVVSCQAGVVHGLEEWGARLGSHARELERRAASVRDGHAGGESTVGQGGQGEDGQGQDGRDAARSPRMRRRDAQSCRDLARFVEEMAARLADVPSTWAGWARWARRLLADLLGAPAGHGQWPPAEIVALDAVHEVLDGLAALDELGVEGPRRQGPSVAELRAALVVELEAPAPQATRLGRGLFVGRVADVVGMDLDVVYVVGMVDGRLPAPVADDVLLPDRERTGTGVSGEVPLRSDGAAEGRRDVLAALAGAAERVLSYPSGDQRHGRDLRPSRLLLDILGHLSGGPRLFAGDLSRAWRRGELLPGMVGTVPSFAAAVAGGNGGMPVSRSDWELQRLTAWVRSGGRVAAHAITRRDPVLGLALAVRGERRRRVVTRFDGRIDDVALPAPATGALASATGLEAYASCPRRYLFDALLGLEERERPEDVLRVSPRDRGIAVHRILQRFVDGELRRSGVAPGRSWGPWGADAEGRLASIAQEELDALEGRGLGGREALWQFDRHEIVASLRRFLRADDDYRRQWGAVPYAAELRFGSSVVPPLEVTVGEGRTVRFAGSIDRVDRTSDDGLFVIDYKTGRRHSSSPANESDPVAAGTQLQLLVYALAARQQYRTTGPVTVAYWYLSPGDGPDAVALAPADEQRFATVVGSLVDGIEGGRFPANPGDPDEGRRGANCRRCPFDSVCPSDRVRTWERKRDDPWLADYLALGELG